MKARLPLFAVALAGLISACSLLVNFDPEGQPCDEQQACLEGYGCVDGRCVSGATNVNCSECPSGGCVPGTNTCLPNTCQYKVCQMAYYCDDDGGVPPTCKLLPAGRLGAQCQDDSFCTGPNDVCVFGAIQSSTTGGLRGGICAEKCGADDTCPPETQCRSFTLANDAGVTRVCLSANTATACTSDAVCARAELVCTVYDHPEVGAFSACDKPLNTEPKAAVGEPCVTARGADGGGELCSNGLCVPQLPPDSDRVATCGQLCEPGGCASGACELVEFSVVSSSTRYLPMCVPAPTRCASCITGPSACAADAPHCTNLNGDLRCLGACTPDAGVLPACPSGYTCGAVADAGMRCIPSLGFCP